MLSRSSFLGAGTIGMHHQGSCHILSYGKLNKDNVSSPRGTAVYSPRAHLNISFANSSGIPDCRGAERVVPGIQSGLPPRDVSFPPSGRESLSLASW